jgi:hypothetical protein
LSFAEAIGVIVLIVFAYVLGHHRGDKQGRQLSEQVCMECQKRQVAYVQANYFEKTALSRVLDKFTGNG